MKYKITSILILISILQARTVYGQDYVSILNDSLASWSIIEEGACDNICSEEFFLTGDTIINLNTYQILDGLGYVREDTIQGKVWFYDDWYATEYLVMDLSLALDDTFWIYQSVATQYPFVVDSVFLLAGKKHVRLTYGLGIGIDMCGLSEKIEFIEGTGPNCGFGYQGYANGGIISAYLLCHKKDQIFVYGNKIFYDVCEICQIGIEELKTTETSFSCFPNPFSDKIDFLFFETGIYSVTLFDSAGKKILDFFINGQTHSISTVSFSDGIYFVRVTTTEGKVEFRKLVKE